ncbi:MAG: methenyltetrahydromethanopterin cyclohydrolase [Candidatus Altiarchaeota archaeon]|nr:methenyltetrahydromethanopterin cyclohydrolase [Candidatus Altiarchaeota archaeon]
MMDLGLNHRTYELLEGISVGESTEFSIGGGKATVLDLGVEAEVVDESVARCVAEASMGSLGQVEIEEGKLCVDIPAHPAIATLSCQLAGWSIRLGGGKKLGSGPARIPARKPGGLIDEVGYHESPEKSSLVLETDILPGEGVCEGILEATGSSELIIAAFRDDSVVGLINVLARVVEVGLFRLHNIGFDVNRISSARGEVAIPPITRDIMFTSNDAIIYQGRVSLKVDGWDSGLTPKAVSKSSSVYGKSFKEIFSAAGGDFYKVDADIFAPARLEVTDLMDGKEYSAGEVKPPA